MTSSPRADSQAQCWHRTFSTNGRLVAFPDEWRRRRAVHKLAAVAGDVTVLFCFVDDHFHVVVLCALQRARVIGRSLLRSLATIAAAPLKLVDRRPVKTRSHLNWLVEYLLKQLVHHGITGTHPALWTGSCFTDLCGARVVPGLRLRFRDALPRYPEEMLFRHVSVSPDELSISDEMIRSVGAAHLAAAAGAAFAAGPLLGGCKDPSSMLAKRAACQLGREVELPRAELAWALGVTPQTAGRLLRPALPRPLLDAVRMRVALEVVCRSRLLVVEQAPQEERGRIATRG